VNLSNKATEDCIRESFSKYGELAEVNILKKPNGQMVGCAFIQYNKTNHAAKAILETNAKPFLGRPIAVDWAVPKEVFKGKKSRVSSSVHGPPGSASGPVSHKYGSGRGSGSFSFLIQALSGLK
jgi:RNA recognition motif-containing protein